MKYIIYLHWRRETNAFTVIEDTSPSHINTHTHSHFGLKNTGWKTESREKLIFLQQKGGQQRERHGESTTKKEDDGGRGRKAVGGENRGVSKEARIGGNKERRGSEADRDRWTE